MYPIFTNWCLPDDGVVIMQAIEVEGLGKVFQTKEKGEGLRGSVDAIFRPRYRSISAVNDISFQVQKGEMVAFIGPNGAGKSTTIKMLTGILHPTCGLARVLGLIPWRDRYHLSFHIGSVFGQKSQLWYHPTGGSFALLGRIYEQRLMISTVVGTCSSMPSLRWGNVDIPVGSYLWGGDEM